MQEGLLIGELRAGAGRRQAIITCWRGLLWPQLLRAGSLVSSCTWSRAFLHESGHKKPSHGRAVVWQTKLF